jgi:hypothetical protein
VADLENVEESFDMQINTDLSRLKPDLGLARAEVTRLPVQSLLPSDKSSSQTAQSNPNKRKDVEHGKSSTFIRLQSLLTYAWNQELVDVIAIVEACLGRDEKTSSCRFLLRDDSRAGAPSVEATLYQFHVELLPEVHIGECVLLKSVRVFLNGKKIPCVESSRDSGWLVWDRLGNPVRHAGLGQIATMDLEEMQHLRKWWSSRQGTTP